MSTQQGLQFPSFRTKQFCNSYLVIRTFVMLFFFSTFKFHASCATDLYIWPATKKINTTSVFMLSGRDIPYKTFFLKSDKETVSLQALVYCVGANGMKRILLSPGTKLKPNTKYQLYGDTTKIILAIKESGAPEPVIWKTTSLADESAPHLLEFPKEVKTEKPSKMKNVLYEKKFMLRAEEDSPMYVRVLVSDPNKNIQVQLVEVKQDGTFSLAMDDCHGGFGFDHKTRYEIKFQLCDSSGNVTDLEEHPVYLERTD